MPGGGSSKPKNCGGFFWNSETGELLGRTGKSWALIGLFYLVYYGALAGFFAICLVGFYHTLDSQAPTQTYMASLLKQNPGMGYRPYLGTPSTLIQFKVNDTSSYEDYIENIAKTLEIYNSKDGENAVNCSGMSPEDRAENQVCKFPLSMLGDKCTSENGFGYPEGKPCVLLKLNRVYGWAPKPLENGSEIVEKNLKDRFDPDYIGITCDGENEADVESIRSLTYYPNKGFPAVFYPYVNQEGYITPVVMVQFDVVPGRLLLIWCRAWAKNIKHHRADRQGSVHFELLVDHGKV